MDPSVTSTPSQRKKPYNSTYQKIINSNEKSKHYQRKRSLLPQRRKQHQKSKTQCDWLLAGIIFIGFTMGFIILLVIYLVIRHNVLLPSKSRYDIDGEFGSSVIDYSREVDITKVSPSDIPSPLQPFKSLHLLNSSLWITLRDEIDVIKIPYNTTYWDKLYFNEGDYFNNFTHYHDNWKYLTENNNWFIPNDIQTKYYGKNKTYSKWSYDIINYPITPNYLVSAKDRSNIMISIVTQTSMDRLHLLEMIAQNWNGVISVCIYIRLEESLLHSQQLIHELFEKTEKEYPALLDISLLFETDYLYKRKDGGYYSVMYPVNHLRNIALQTAKTDLVLLTDGDFIPNNNFHNIALEQYNIAQSKYKSFRKKRGLFRRNKTVNVSLIIPAFEFGSSYFGYTKKQRIRRKKKIMKEEELNIKHISNLETLPLDKKEIVKLYKQDKVRGFHIHRCTACHKPTNYTKWLTANNPYIVSYKASYEPYIMTKRIGLRRYDARFRGYGWNKIIHLLSLAWVDKYHWVVANDLFIFHIPHQSSRDANQFFKGKDSQRWKWMSGLSKLSLRELKKKRDQVGYIVS